MDVRVLVFTSICVCLRKCLWMLAGVLARVPSCAFVGLLARARVCVFVCVRARARARACVCVCVCLWLCSCLFLCLWLCF